MSKFWTIVTYILVAIVAIKILQAVADANADKKKKIDDLIQKLKNKESEMASINRRLLPTVRAAFTGTAPYSAVITTLQDIVGGLQEQVYNMRNINRDLVRISVKQDQTDAIDRIEAKYMPRAKQIVAGFEEFAQKVEALQPSYMMDQNNYGKCNKAYWDSVCTMDREAIMAYISKCETAMKNDQPDEIYAIDPEKILRGIWYLATEKTFSATDFQKAKSLFGRIYKRTQVDVLLAELYAKKKMGGEKVLRDPVRSLVNGSHSSQIYTLLASGLMWMNAYESETTVLQSMLSSGKEMTAKTQERLHSLTNGGGKAPGGFDVHSSGDTLYFDVSSLAWRDDEYVGLFENLAFQDKPLSYSLAVRDENKDMFIPHGIHIPDADMILRKIRAVFAEEYGAAATAQNVNCIALSGSGEENVSGILVSSQECKQMAVLIHIAKIGKKLIIKFYTLFMPDGTDLAAQKQQALSLSKKLSPNVTMWESSLKDTLLMAVEQMLNSAPPVTNDKNVDGTTELLF